MFRSYCLMKSKNIFLLANIAVLTSILLTMLTIDMTNKSYNAFAQSQNGTQSQNSSTSKIVIFANMTNNGSPGMMSNSNATGNATFTLMGDGKAMSYKISGTGIQGNISQIDISSSTGGRYTTLALLHYAPTQDLITKHTGTATGNLTTADFIGPLKGKSMQDFVKMIQDGNVYIRVQTITQPLFGEIGGKLQLK